MTTLARALARMRDKVNFTLNSKETLRNKNLVTVFSRHGCHLCENAVTTLEGLAPELNFDLEIKYIEGSAELEKLYGEQVPVIHIDGKHHDFWKVDPERFKSSLEKHRRHQ